MEKGKRLLSYFGSVFAFCMLALVVLLPGAKADAALTVSEVNYDNSTITIQTTSGDQVLYFSDKNKRKWETVTDSFVGDKCTMDISWVSLTKDYEITFKGDQTNKKEDILSVKLPKQVTTFKAKYDQATGEVKFTGLPTGRTVEYRKNNTVDWENVPDDADKAKSIWQGLCENGASVYFRLKATKELRPSKEVACKINKKAEAPNVTVNGSDATIPVQANWQVRAVTINEKSGVQYVTGMSKANDAYEVDDAQWHTYEASEDISLEDIAKDAMDGTKEVILQFRKGPSSSSQVSHITTVKIPKRNATRPDKDAAGVSLEYTSTTTFKLTISNATAKRPYEFCVVDKEDVTGNSTSWTINDMDSVTWKAVTSNTALEVKKAEAPNEGILFFREKSVGSVGSDDFKLASPETWYDIIEYPTTSADGLNAEKWTIDGVCTTENSSGHIQFTMTTQYNAKISKITLNTQENLDYATTDGVATVNSTVALNKNPDTSKKGADKYLITATITNISLNDGLKDKLSKDKKLDLYGYVELETSGSKEVYYTSNKTSGLRIHILPNSKITDVDTTKPENAVNVTRFVGYSNNTDNPSNKSNYQYETFWFGVEFGKDLGTNLTEYDGKAETGRTLAIESVKLGNYELGASDYSCVKEGSNDYYTFTVNLYQFEDNEALYSYYNTAQDLIITLNNGEKLKGATVTLVPPVSLNDTYAWAFRQGKLPETEQTVKVTENGATTEKKVYQNNYSVNFSKTSKTGKEGLKVDKVTCNDATLLNNDGSDIESIYYDITNSTNGKVEFYNDALNRINQKLTSAKVRFDFTVTYSDGRTQEYSLDKGCTFTIQ